MAISYDQWILEHPNLQEFQILEPTPFAAKPRLVKDRNGPTS